MKEKLIEVALPLKGIVKLRRMANNANIQCYRNSSNRRRLHCRCVIFMSDAQDTTEATVTAARQGVATVAIADRCADLGLHPQLT